MGVFILKIRTMFCVLLICVASYIVMPLQPTLSFSDAILKVGIKHDDVYELQGRLKYLGYYTGDIDGAFGWQTYWAVRNFQWKFGMQVDGVVGAKTKLMLWKATKNWTPSGQTSGSNASSSSASNLRAASHGYTASEIDLMAHAVYGEARGEIYEGQVAVAAVILNRIASELFPNSVAGVIYQPGAFTAVADGQINLEPNDTAFQAVKDALNGWDPSLGALYYFNPDTATSAWIWSRPQIKQIGKHIFTK